MNFLKKLLYASKKCVGVGKSTLMSFFDGLGPSTFPPKIEKTQPTRKKIDRLLFAIDLAFLLRYEVGFEMKVGFEVRRFSYEITFLLQFFRYCETKSF